MTSIGIDGQDPRTARPEPTGPFTRVGHLVRPHDRLGDLAHRRPAGITASQWNAAIRTTLDFVVSDAATERPLFAVEFVDPATRTVERQRQDRGCLAVCGAIGLGLLRIVSPRLRADRHGRWIVGYLADARAFAADATDSDPADPATRRLGYRDIIGRLPDGRTGYVNDLSTVARAGAVEAYVSGRMADPIVRGLSATWRDGPAEGWGWATVRDGWYVFERVLVEPHRVDCGIDPGRLAEDLATVAVGARIPAPGTDAGALHDREQLARELAALRARRAELAAPFGYEHVSFD